MFAGLIKLVLTGLERTIAEAAAKAKAKEKMQSYGAIQGGYAGHAPVVRHENIGGGANETIDGQIQNSTTGKQGANAVEKAAYAKGRAEHCVHISCISHGQIYCLLNIVFNPHTPLSSPTQTLSVCAQSHKSK